MTVRRSSLPADARLLDGALVIRSGSRIHYDIRDVPGWGRLLAAVSARGVCRVDLRPGPDAVSALFALAPEVLRSPTALEPFFREVAGYFAGKSRPFSSPPDLTCVTPFTRKVLTAAVRIPRGRTLSYGELAARIGRPGAARAIGGAMGRNPVPILVPCHRVLGAGGALGGFTGGTDLKRRLLACEGYIITV